MLGTYIDDCLNIMHTVILGEISWRLICAVKEYFIYRYHYEVPGRLWQIFKRSFSTNSATQTYLLFIVCGTLCRCSMTLRFPCFSNLQYAYWIRGSHGLDYAEGMASNYFHGYLKLCLPSHNEGEGIKQRIALYESQEGVKFILKRLVILVPSTMFVNSKVESSILTRDGIKPLETVVKNRAGVARPFKNDVYRFTKPINGTYYYVALEGATPLLSFFEAMHHRTSMTWQMVDMKREILLKFYRHLKKLLNDWPETRHQAELILYNSSYDGEYSQDVGEVLLAHIANMSQRNCSQGLL
uniref:STING ligand-binding domain-containing protein n=1 Tax=Glossina morsitans morsitans TaxID=37546 RepID=A0A1B0FMX4_GLOMM